MNTHMLMVYVVIAIPLIWWVYDIKINTKPQEEKAVVPEVKPTSVVLESDTCTHVGCHLRHEAGEAEARRKAEQRKKMVEACKHALLLLLPPKPLRAVAAVLLVIFLRCGYDTRNVASRQPQQARAEVPMTEYYVMSWEKPEGYAGANSKQRTLPEMQVEIVRNDSDILEFTSPGGTRFHWEKREEYGVWSDAAGNAGRIKLKPEGAGFEGGVCDNEDASPVWSKLHIKRRRV